MPQTITEKILALSSNKETTKPGDFIKSKVDVALNHDVTSVLAFEAMKKMGSQCVWDPSKVVVILDHVAPPSSINSARVHNIIRDFVKDQNISNFFDVNSGICHQVLPEHGFVKPGSVIIGADSHTCTHGAFGAFASGVGSTDMGAVLAKGKIWLKVPETINVSINGDTSKYVHPKDIILKLAGMIGVSGATYQTIEFTGETITDMTISGRMTLCNMAIEMGGKSGICWPDKKTLQWLKRRTSEDLYPIYGDPDAHYKRKIEISPSQMEPQIACPHNVDNVKPISQIGVVKINQVFIGSCTNGRFEDLEQVHRVLKNRKIHPDVRTLIVPASKEIYSLAIEKGMIKDFIEAGAVVSNPSCAACFGGHIGLLGPGEKGLSTSNRNFRGRQGSPEAEVYLSNAEVAAASAILGHITHPEEII